MKKTIFDLDEFRKKVIEGETLENIKKQMNINTPQQLANLQLRLMNTDQKFYDFKSLVVSKPPEYIVTIGDRQNLVIPTKILNKSTFVKGDKFKVSFRGNKITLTKQEPVAATPSTKIAS